MKPLVEVTIEITQFCEGGCPWCSTSATPQGKHIEYEKISAFLDKQTEIKRINISGGEPLAHPEFYRILKLCYSITDNVWVYTNALRQIKYNTHVLKEINVEANVVVVPGENCYISKQVKSNLLKFIPQGRDKKEIYPPVNVSRNFYDPKGCDSCNHILLQANGEVVTAPCVKEYLS